MTESDESQRLALGADLLLHRATPEQLREAVEFLAFKYSDFVRSYGALTMDDLQTLAATDPLGAEMEAIHLESRRAIVSALSSLMGINPAEPTWH